MSNKSDRQHFSNDHFDAIDALSEKENYFSPVLKEVATHLEFDKVKVLDVGCGTGLFMKTIIDAGCTECYGVDGSHGHLQRALKRGYKEIRLVEDLSSSALPFNDASFDFVVCKDVLEHLLHPLHALAEIKRVLKKNGLFLVHVPNHFPLYGRAKFLLNNNIDTFSFFGNENRWTFPHIRFYEYNDFINQLILNGFEPIKNLSGHFALIPIVQRLPMCKRFIERLATNYPNQFSNAFTILLRNND
jgi:ubiquinone/menaquinone biosynthesis C-methylase UbiE